MKLQSLFFIMLSVISVAVAVTVPDIINHFENAKTHLNNLNSAINSFREDGATVDAATAIHTDLKVLSSSADNGTSDIKAYGSFSEAEGTAVLQIVQSYEPTILDLLLGLISLKPDFDALPSGGIPALIKQDITQYNVSRNAIEAALTNAFPPDLASGELTVRHSIDDAFAAAIVVYG